MKKNNILLAVLAIALVLCVSVGTAVAYFTTSVTAAGAIKIELGSTTTIEEPDVIDWVKHVEITNKADSKQDVFVRARAFYPSQYPVTYDGEGWSDGGDGWWYYSEPLAPGQTANTLLAEIHDVPAPEDAPEGDSFNVTVVYEATPVQYNDDGSTFADWDFSLNDGTTEGGN